jgi:hypothetical protein
MFEPEVVARAGVTRGLVFVDTDHGFNLGHEPRSEDAWRGLLVARARNDAHDRELYERLGQPPTYRYAFDFHGRLPPRLVPFAPPESARYEAEADWPALLQQGHAYPIHFPCASRGKALRLLRGTRLTLPVASAAGSQAVSVGWLGTTGEGSKVRIRWESTAWRELSADGPGCTSLRLPGRPPSTGAGLELELLEGEGALDFVQIEPGPP